MSRFGFSAVHEDEGIVFGAEAPGRSHVEVEVDDWIGYMKLQGIKRVVCLLSKQQLQYYNSLPNGLLGAYRRAFGDDNVLHAETQELHLSEQKTLQKILSFLRLAELQSKPVVVHCLAGLGRTGHVLAAWLVYRRGLSVESALKALTDMGRDPDEAVAYGNATRNS